MQVDKTFVVDVVTAVARKVFDTATSNFPSLWDSGCEKFTVFPVKYNFKIILQAFCPYIIRDIFKLMKFKTNSVLIK